MGIFSGNYNDIDHVTLKHPEALLEAYIYDELSALSDSQKKAFLESEECAVMEAKKLIGRKTLIRLSKSDDLNRRTTMAAMQLAKENKDPLWDKLVKNRVKERELLGKIRQKYSNKAQRAAKIGQREHLKNTMGSKFLKKEDLDNRA